MIFDDLKSFVLSHSSEHLSTPGALRALQGDFATSADRTAHFRKDRLHPQCVSFPLCSSKCYPRAQKDKPFEHLQMILGFFHTRATRDRESRTYTRVSMSR